MTSLLFDSFALLRFFQGEPGGETVRELLHGAISSQTPRLMSAMNLGELIYIVQRRLGGQKKLEMFVHLQQMGFTILPCPNELIFRAAEMKARYPISYADAFALVSAMEQSATLVTGDPEFRKVEHLVQIIWV
ncbi:MAG TPA: type II toxin-antitoxin system VapC family toxin [Geobacterales bacterium]|nr:type II toxin-antitoxin system VapC family toxin [Geobacterales bacterium]